MNSTHPKNTAPAQGSAGRAQFPSARYFQIHFEHLQTQLLETRESLNALQQQVADLQNGLTRNDASAGD
jgi:polyhydroxyalkanoate synthesis regulator phasin